MGKFLTTMAFIMAALVFSGCKDDIALATSSFGPSAAPDAKASPASVISMGRDDDDGKAKKWHIGGALD